MSKSATQTRSKASDDASAGPGSQSTGMPGGFAAAPYFAGAMTTGADMMRAWFAASQDMGRFYNERLRKDAAQMQAYAKCRTPEELAAVTRQAMSEAAHDYADQFDRVLRLSLKVLPPSKHAS